jgi:flavin-binding protein dodecin
VPLPVVGSYRQVFSGEINPVLDIGPSHITGGLPLKYFLVDISLDFRLNNFIQVHFLKKEVIRMTEPRVARVTEIIAGSPKGFEDAVKVGFARATKTLRGITGMRVIEFRVAVENSKIVEYRVRMEIIFVLET